jgi:ATP-dependent DNA ligase
MLTVPVESPDLPAQAAGEVKWDGYRAQLGVWEDGRVLLRSRQGTDMTTAFPEIRTAALDQVPPDTGLDGELVVWEDNRLAFGRLQQRLARRGASAAEGARLWPAHYVAFDVLHLHGTDVTGWPYSRRRAALEELFAGHGLHAPLTLCPSTTDPATAREWLGWTAVGLEGLVFKPLNSPYRPGARAWQKYKARQTTEAIVGAVTGSLALPRTLLLGRYDEQGRLQYVGRSTSLSQAVGRAVAEHLTPATAHPWKGWTFSAGWGSTSVLDPLLVQPTAVAEVAVDVARDRAGRWRHAARLHRIRTDLDVHQVPLAGRDTSE